MTDFERSLVFTLREEGGFSNNPKDPGGATMEGVTQRAFDKYLTAHNQPHRFVKTITSDEMRGIYYSDYWHVAGCDNFAWPLCLAVFDFAVNSGPECAVRHLQTLVGEKEDGRFGPKTRAAASRTPPVYLAEALCEARRVFYHEVVQHRPESAEFLDGWLGRVERLEHLVKSPEGK